MNIVPFVLRLSLRNILLDSWLLWSPRVLKGDFKDRHRAFRKSYFKDCFSFSSQILWVYRTLPSLAVFQVGIFCVLHLLESKILDRRFCFSFPL